ncbi:TetR/AcrR family transcriptional regulator [Streptomyces sp. NPDC058653]|uniref:TetR/AcrR family transcriptional regulator n=1 Tax=Streptomyces sp. NPDC058653 TaxID=3346576 RepID=UPI00364BBEBE
MPARQKPENGAPTEGPPLWERLERPAPAPRATLTPARIAAAAVELADREGLDAVTMRRLAGELGVAPMAAYRYVTGKDELLELMADFVYGEMRQDGEAGDWREALRGLAVRTRAVRLRHPWLSRAAPHGPTPNQLVAPERGLASLHGLGLDADLMMVVFRTVIAYVDGSVDAELALRRMREERGWTGGQESRTALAPRMAWLMNTGRYPNYERYLHEGTRKDDPDWQFETGLDCVLDGIAARTGI